MTIATHVRVAALFVLLVSVYTWPLARDPGHLLPMSIDPRLFSWVMLSMFRNLVTDPALLFHGTALYPIGSSLALAEPLLVPALMAGPLFALTDNPVLAYNLTLMVFWALSGWGMYAVAFWLTRQHLAAFVAGVIFTFAPYRMDHYPEFQMEMAFGIPLTMYALVRFLETQRRRYLIALLVVFGIQAASVWYYAIILSLGLAVVALQVAALRWTGWRLRPACHAGVGLLALGLVLYPVAAPYFHVRQLNYTRGLDEAVRRSANVLSYVEGRANWLYEAFTTVRDWEASLFLGIFGFLLAASGLLWLRRAPGEVVRSRVERWLAAGTWLVLGLTLLALVTRGRLRVGPFQLVLPFTACGVTLLLAGLARHAAEGWRRWRTGLADRRLSERDWVAILIGLAGFAFLLSLGPIVVLGNRTLGAGLYAWLWPYLLPLHAIRGPTRIGVLYLFSGALLAAFGVTWLRRRCPPQRYRILVSLLLLGLLLEYAWMPLRYQRVPLFARPVDVVLRAAPHPTAVLEWPINSPDTDADAMFRSLAHGKHVLNGVSGFVPAFVRDVSLLLTTPGPVFPVPEAQAALRQIYPLRYLVVRLDDPAVTAEWRSVWRALRAHSPPLLAFRGSFGAEDLYEVIPTPERGVRLERWMSYQVLRRHPALTLKLRPLAVSEDRDRWVELSLNSRVIRRIPLNGETTATVIMPTPAFQAAPNVIAIDHGYRPRQWAPDGSYLIGSTGVRSPGDVRVVSVGQPRGSASSIRVNGTELSPDRRGYNLVAIDGTGHGVGAKVFDTFASAGAAAELAGWVESLAAGTIVAGAVRDEGSARLTADAVAALGQLGVRGDLRGRFREAHAFIGVKGAPPGTALEALGPGPLELVVGHPHEESGIELLDFRLE